MLLHTIFLTDSLCKYSSKVSLAEVLKVCCMRTWPLCSLEECWLHSPGKCPGSLDTQSFFLTRCRKPCAKTAYMLCHHWGMTLSLWSLQVGGEGAPTKQADRYVITNCNNCHEGFEYPAVVSTKGKTHVGWEGQGKSQRGGGIWAES